MNHYFIRYSILYIVVNETVDVLHVPGEGLVVEVSVNRFMENCEY